MPSLPRQVIEEFIAIYKSEPCLWNLQSKEYRDRHKKTVAYEKLVEKYQEVEPGADRDAVVKKINNLRTNFRKELKKVGRSTKSGNSSNFYVPKLWYFPLLLFLKDHDPDKETAYNIDFIDCENQKSDDPDYGSSTESQTRPEIHSSLETRSKGKRTSSVPLVHSSKKTKTDTAKEVSVTEGEYFERPREQTTEHRFDIFGKNIAFKLRELERTQRIIVEKIISDALFEAEMGTLTRSHKLIRVTSNEDESPPPSPTTLKAEILK